MVVAATRVALPVLAASWACFWRGSKLWGCQELSASPLLKDEIIVPARLEEEEAVGEAMVDEEEELPVKDVSECAFWSEAICLIMLVAELLNRLCQCFSFGRHSDYEEACAQDGDENGHGDEELQDAEPEGLEVESVDEADKTKIACLRAEELEELSVEAVGAEDQTKKISLQPKELAQQGVEAVDESDQEKKASSQPKDAESNMHLAGVPSPTRTRGLRLNVKSKCPLRRAEVFLAQDPQLACEAADCTIPEDEEWDDRSFHQGRSETLATFVAAYRLLKTEARGLKADLKQLNDAGLELQDEVERLMKENRNLEGDVAYWRELAEGVSPMKGRQEEDSGFLDEEGTGTENQESEEEGSAQHVSETGPSMNRVVGEQQVQHKEDLTKYEKVHLDVDAGEEEQQVAADILGEHAEEVHIGVQQKESDQQVREESLPQQIREVEAFEEIAKNAMQMLKEPVEKQKEQAPADSASEERLLIATAEAQRRRSEADAAAVDYQAKMAAADELRQMVAKMQEADLAAHGRAERELLHSDHKQEVFPALNQGDHIQQEDESKTCFDNVNELMPRGRQQLEGQYLIEREEIMGLCEQQRGDEHHSNNVEFARSSEQQVENDDLIEHTRQAEPGLHWDEEGLPSRPTDLLDRMEEVAVGVGGQQLDHEGEPDR